MQRSKLHQFIVYTLLIVGAVVFSIPFVWMLGSSMKVDREQQSDSIKLLPNTPIPRKASPYIDDQYFSADKIQGDWTKFKPVVEALVGTSGFEIPANVDHQKALDAVTTGVGLRLNSRFPASIWQNTPEAFIAEAKPVVTKELVANVYENVFRYFAVGPVHIRGEDVELYEIGGGGASPSGRWTIAESNLVKAVDINDNGKPASQLDYNFAAGNAFSLVGNFKTPVDAAKLRRVQIDIHPDDTWHDLTVTVKHSGKKYVSHHDTSLANFDWQTVTWQHKSLDDVSTKLRTWVVLDEAGTSDVKGPSDLKVTITVDRVSQAMAWANKIKLNYQRTNEQIPFFRYVRVSVFLVGANIVLTLLSSSLVAYAFARITWPGRDLCFVLMLATMMIPTQVTMIPNFLIWTHLGAYNTLGPLWIGAAFGNAFFIFMLRQFMAGIPRDLEDAARIDGCGFLRIYWHVILPLVKPSLAAIAVMSFIGTWNDFMGPLIYIADQRLYPLAFGLYAFSVQVINNPALSMAGSVLMTLPIIAIFFAAQRYFIQGVTLTGMKG